MVDLWKSFCEHAIHEEDKHAKRDHITPTVEPVTFNTGDSEDESDDSDYDSEVEEEEEHRRESLVNIITIFFHLYHSTSQL